MRKILGIALVLLAVTCSIAHAKGQTASALPDPDHTGIIAPAVATGAARFSYYTFASDTGEVLVCPPSANHYPCEINKRPAWKTLRGAVPAGRTYVGFRLVSSGYGEPAYEVFWK